MGFSLESFFKELIAILESDSGKTVKYTKLYLCIMDAYKYAKECGKI